MAKDLAGALDDCLTALAQGIPLEECLARYPQWAEELRSLLEVATELRQVPPLAPDPVRQEAAHRRFLQRAAALGAPGQAGVLPPRSGLPLLARLAALAAGLLLVVMLLGGATVALAWDSQPDSPLYPVKLATERARLWLTFDDEDKARLLLEQSERRLQEIRNLMARGKAVSPNVLAALRRRTDRVHDILTQKDVSPEIRDRAEKLWARQEGLLLSLRDSLATDADDEFAAALVVVHNGRLALQGRPSPLPITPRQVTVGLIRFAGPVRQERPGLLTVGGWPVVVDEHTIFESDATDGQGRNGLVTAVRDDAGQLRALIVVLGDRVLEGDIRLRGVLEKLERGRWRIGGHIFSVDEATLARGRLRPGALAEVRGRPTRDQELRAAVVRALGSQIFLYEGAYGGIRRQDGAVYWIVGGQEIRVTAVTFIDARAAPVQKGRLVRVEGLLRDSQPLALRIRTLPAFSEGGTVRLEGALRGVDGGRWSLAGIPVNVEGAEGPLSPPPLGSWLQVEGVWAGRVLMAQTVRVGPKMERQVLVEGPVEEVKEGLLKVGGTLLRLSADTVVRGTVTPGAYAVVQSVAAADGSLQAVQVEAWGGPPPSTPEPTPVP